MPHHFTKSTVEASVWCNACMKMTPWRIADGRRQYCLICYEKIPHSKTKETPPEAQKELFDERGEPLFISKNSA